MGFLDTLFGSSSLPSSPTSQSTQTSTPSVQSWAQPYINNYLNQGQNLVANQQTPELLNQSYVGAANLQLPGGFASGQALAEAGGRGSLSTVPMALEYGKQGADYGSQGIGYGKAGAAFGTQGAGIGVLGGAQYGEQGAGYGQQATEYGKQAAGAGQQYAQQATSPEAMAQYMSPYMQNVVDYQKSQAIRDFAKQTPALQAQAVGQGAYGGSRQAIVQSEANRALNSQLQGIEALGQQQAYQNAQQAQQYGANLGLQGLQTGIQSQQAGIQGAQAGLQGVGTQMAGTAQGMQGQQLGLQGLGTAMQGSQIGLQGVGGAQQGYSGATQAGGTLGNIAAQQAQAKLAALQLQNQFGMQQQMFPYQQLQFQQSLMQNLPFTSTSTTGQGYQAPPNALSQTAGTLGTLGSLYLLSRAKGGVIKSYADGGDISADTGSNIPAGYVYSETQGKIVPIGPNSGAMPGPMLTYPGMETPQPIGGGIGGLLPQPGYDVPRNIPGIGSPAGGGMPGVISPGSGFMPEPTPDNAAYVNSLYQNMFGRQADQGGYQHNLDLLNAGKIDQRGLANAFAGSAEGQQSPYIPRLMGSGLADIRLNQLLGAR